MLIDLPGKSDGRGLYARLFFAWLSVGLASRREALNEQIEPPDQGGTYEHHAFLADRHPEKISWGYFRIGIRSRNPDFDPD